MDVQLKDETVWLTQDQMAQLFDRDRTVIGRHIRNIFSEGELDESLVCAKFALPKKYGRRDGFVQEIYATIYNLDVIISVGYRVKSQRGTQFRQWATRIIKDYMLRGYAFNQRIERLEQRVNKTEEQIDFFVRTSLPPVEGIFYEGQIFSAHTFVADLIRSAKTRIVLIDNYIDDRVLTLLDKREDGVNATIYTKNFTKQLSLDIQQHNKQFVPISVEPFGLSHDRFLIIDDVVYHIGASLKDLGKAWFAFTKMNDVSAEELLGRIK